MSIVVYAFTRQEREQINSEHNWLLKMLPKVMPLWTTISGKKNIECTIIYLDQNITKKNTFNAHEFTAHACLRGSLKMIMFSENGFKT